MMKRETAMKIARKIFALLMAAVWPAMVAHADMPRLINFQGRLADGAGQPITAPTPVTVRLFSQGSGGIAVYSEQMTVQPDANGVYAMLVGSVNPLTNV